MIKSCELTDLLRRMLLKAIGKAIIFQCGIARLALGLDVTK